MPADTKKYSYGHCPKRAQPGGCQEHNLHCGYPSCDRQEIPADQVPSLAERIEATRHIFEERAYQVYFVSTVGADLKLTGPLKYKVDFCARDPDGSYTEKTLDASWWGWRTAIENLDKLQIR